MHNTEKNFGRNIQAVQFNDEMSFNPDSHEPKRLEYYASRHYSGQGIQGSKKSYKDLVETFQIAILAKENFFPDEVLVHQFQYYDPIHNIPLGGKCRIITVEGLQEGAHRKAQEIAQKMKKAGRPLSEIEEYTGLSAEIIDKI